MTPGKPRLRKREILAALAAGALAAGGAALVLTQTGPAEVERSERAVASGPQQRTYQVADFDGIASSGRQDIVITAGEEIAVRGEGPGEVLAQIEVVVEGGTLQIRPRDGRDSDWDALRGVTFHVTVPRLEAVTVTGFGDVRIDRIAGNRFSGIIAGRGELAIGEMEVEDADFSIGGSGDVVVAGTARNTKIAIGGSGNVRAASLRSETAEITIAGRGDVELAAQERARVTIMGSGDVDISGPATCSVTKVGRGDVRCGGDEVEG